MEKSRSKASLWAPRELRSGFSLSRKSPYPVRGLVWVLSQLDALVLELPPLIFHLRSGSQRIQNSSDGLRTGISATPNQVSPSWSSGRIPGHGPEASGADTQPPSRGWGHTSASPSNVAPLYPDLIPAPAEPTPSPRLPCQESASPSPTLTLRQSCLPPPTEAPQPRAGWRRRRWEPSGAAVDGARAGPVGQAGPNHWEDLCGSITPSLG